MTSFDPIIYGILAGLAAIAGIYSVYFFTGWTKKNYPLVAGFAAGLLLANAFFHLLPEAVALASAAWPFWILGAIVVFYFLEQAFIIHSCHEEHCEHHVVGKMSLIGLGLHSLIDGLAIGISFEVSFSLGVVISFALILHKIAEGGCTYALLAGGPMSQKHSLLYSWLMALATPLGAVLAFIFLPGLSKAVLGGLLAATAGAFIYISASDLLPTTHKKYNFWGALAFLLGVIFVISLNRF